MWTSAACLAQLVGTYRRARPQRPGSTEKQRTLSEADFEFRGGFPHWLGGSIARTRTGEPAFGWQDRPQVAVCTPGQGCRSGPLHDLEPAPGQC